jgi:hypothetical protein
MTKTRTTKYRLILSFTEQHVAFEKLFRELVAIEDEFSSDATLIAQEKRKHFMKILLAHCSYTTRHSPSNLQATQVKPVSSQTEEAVHRAESNSDPPLMLAPAHPPTTPPKTQRAHEKSIAANDLPKSEGVLSFGKFLLEIN